MCPSVPSTIGEVARSPPKEKDIWMQICVTVCSNEWLMCRQHRMHGDLGVNVCVRIPGDQQLLSP